MILLHIVMGLVILELAAWFVVNRLRPGFQWLITPKDEVPRLDSEGLKKFIAHGFDGELGWVRKPNTWHTERGKCGETSYHIDDNGSRCNPGHEKLNADISCYGDSFSFCRQVNDDQTWQWYLSESSQAGVLNFSSGNYGLDQAYLLMEKNIKKIKTDIVILGVVPSTIVRILCVWKHYNEFGNTFGFKPRFELQDGGLKLVKNIISSEGKLRTYRHYLPEIQAHDYFYKTKFRDEMIRFPYLFHTLRKPFRNIPLIATLLASRLLHFAHIRIKRLDEYPMMKIMHINKLLRIGLFKKEFATDIFLGIVDKFAALARQYRFTPVFLLMPQKDDILYIRKRGAYYAQCMKRVSEKMQTIDLTETLLNAPDLDALYSDDNVYGGHFSPAGNAFVAKAIFDRLRSEGAL